MTVRAADIPKLQARSSTPRCANCRRTIPSSRRGNYFDVPPGFGPKSDLVCCMACGDELAHRIVRAVPGVLALLLPDERSTWRDYKAGGPSRVVRR